MRRRQQKRPDDDNQSWLVRVLKYFGRGFVALMRLALAHRRITIFLVLGIVVGAYTAANYGTAELTTRVVNFFIAGGITFVSLLFFSQTASRIRRIRRPTGKKLGGIKKALWVKQKRRCNGCKKKLVLGSNATQVDHIIPVSAGPVAGGTNEQKNLQLLCIDCNSLKGTGTMLQLKHKLRKRQGTTRTLKRKPPSSKRAVKKRGAKNSTAGGKYPARLRKPGL